MKGQQAILHQNVRQQDSAHARKTIVQKQRKLLQLGLTNRITPDNQIQETGMIHKLIDSSWSFYSEIK